MCRLITRRTARTASQDAFSFNVNRKSIPEAEEIITRTENTEVKTKLKPEEVNINLDEENNTDQNFENY